MALNIYTDGGCSGNPGPGGWAFIILQDATVLAEQSGSEKNTTNNRMELIAAISSLECLGKLAGAPKILTLYTDSQYLQKGMSEWLKAWKAKAWRTSDRQPVKNQDLWQRLDSLSGDFSITWAWVKGHAGNIYNERCDAMTQEAIAAVTDTLLHLS